MGLEWRQTGAQSVLNALRADWREETSPIIWCANYGWVDGNTISWEAVKQGLAWKVYNMGTIFGVHQKAPLGLELPEFADYLVIPSPKVTGEIVTPYGIHDWNSEILTKTNWKLVDTIKAPKGSVTIYRKQLPIEKRDFSDAIEWIQFCFNRKD